MADPYLIASTTLLAAAIFVFVVFFDCFKETIIVCVVIALALAWKNPVDPKIVGLFAVLSTIVLLKVASLFSTDLFRIAGQVGFLRTVWYFSKAFLLATPVLLIFFFAGFAFPKAYSTALWEGCKVETAVASQSTQVEDSDGRIALLFSTVSTELKTFTASLLGDYALAGAYGLEVAGQTGFYSPRQSENQRYLIARKAPRSKEDLYAWWNPYTWICPNTARSSATHEANTLDTVDNYRFYVARTLFERMKESGESAQNITSDARVEFKKTLFGPSPSSRETCSNTPQKLDCKNSKLGFLPARLPDNLQPPPCRGWLKTPSRCMERRILKPFNNAYQSRRDDLLKEFDGQTTDLEGEIAGGAKSTEDVVDWFVANQLAKASSDAKWWISTWFFGLGLIALISNLWLLLTGFRFFSRLLARFVFSKTGGGGQFSLDSRPKGSPVGEILISKSNISGETLVDCRGLKWHTYTTGEFNFAPNSGDRGPRRCGELLGRKVTQPSRFWTNRFHSNVSTLKIVGNNTTQFATIDIAPSASCFVEFESIVGFSDNVKFKTRWHWGLASNLLGSVKHTVAEVSSSDVAHGYLIICSRKTDLDVFPKTVSDNEDMEVLPGLIAYDIAGQLSVSANVRNFQTYLTQPQYFPVGDTAAVLAHDPRAHTSVGRGIFKTVLSIIVPF